MLLFFILFLLSRSYVANTVLGNSCSTRNLSLFLVTDAIDFLYIPAHPLWILPLWKANKTSIITIRNNNNKLNCNVIIIVNQTLVLLALIYWRYDDISLGIKKILQEFLDGLFTLVRIYTSPMLWSAVCGLQGSIESKIEIPMTPMAIITIL